ncbi:MAG: molybdenum cofactor guanylyltransferase [Candidatus Omnitrophica bacterium]|nr:molybdenum cofactor guanylyltransferase [Candidatus Omnitrophota bacterium]
MDEIVKVCVLAGGKSERFGTDKRFFKIEGKFMIEIIVSKLKNFFDEIFILCDDKKIMEKKLGILINNLNLKLMEDKIKYMGPLYAIYNFFNEVNYKNVLFFPVDMPFIPVEFIKFFLNLIEKFNFEKIILISEDRPLPIFLSFNFKEELGDYLKNCNSIKGFIRKLKLKNEYRIYFVKEEELRIFGDYNFYLKNINKREDLYGS